MDIIMCDLDLNDLFQSSQRGDNKREHDKNIENNEQGCT